MKLSAIKPNPNNPRVLRDDKFKKLVKSLKDFPEMMLKRPIVVDETMTVLGGNMRLRALQHIFGRDGEIPDAWVSVAEGWTEEQKREFIIKDNAAFGEWDWDALANGWDAGDLSEWGIDFPEDWAATEEPPAEAHEDDFDPDAPVDTVCKAGDIWQLGRHRLMCGDSTDAGSVALLMEGKKADIAFTSPPYNMMAGGVTKAFKSDKVEDVYGIENGTYNEFSDDLSNEDYTNLLNASLDNCLAYCDEVLFNIGILKGSKIGVLEMLHKHAEQFSDLLVWNKNACLPLCLPTQIHLLNHICEPIFCFNHSGDRAFSHSQWQLGMMHNRIDTKNANGSEFSKIHHATFPIDLPFYILQNFSENSVFDCFGGTGTTLIAAEQLNRTCYMMELDPHYCDIIIARWEKLTGEKAVKVEK